MQWDKDARIDEREQRSFVALLNEVLYHGEMRFTDYHQALVDGDFPERLQKWLSHVSSGAQQKALFSILRHLLFVDESQMLSLHRDTYRRVITPWLTRGRVSAGDLLAPTFEKSVRQMMASYLICSVTESFNFSWFQSVNALVGIPKPVVLGEEPRTARAILTSIDCSPFDGVIVLEDFVGTGKQASRILKVVREFFGPDKRMLFAPMIILDDWLQNLVSDPQLSDVHIEPTLTIPKAHCVRERPSDGEHSEFTLIRAVVNATASMVTRRLDEQDDPPTNQFGYGKCGALVITCHNASNNALPLLHHRAPQWTPLFVRVHHSKGRTK